MTAREKKKKKTSKVNRSKKFFFLFDLNPRKNQQNPHKKKPNTNSRSSCGTTREIRAPATTPPIESIPIAPNKAAH